MEVAECYEAQSTPLVAGSEPTSCLYPTMRRPPRAKTLLITMAQSNALATAKLHGRCMHAAETCADTATDGARRRNERLNKVNPDIQRFSECWVNWAKAPYRYIHFTHLLQIIANNQAGNLKQC